MFDWDSDYEAVVETRLLPQAAPVEPVVDAVAVAEPPCLPGAWSRLSSRWVMAASAGLGLAAAGLAALSVPAPSTLAAPVLALFLGWLAPVPVMPEGLLAYDQSQFVNFHRGISRFSDAELLSYVRTTEAMLHIDNPLAVFARDALYLAHREIDRRGLRRPVASLRPASGAA